MKHANVIYHLLKQEWSSLRAKLYLALMRQQQQSMRQQKVFYEPQYRRIKPAPLNWNTVGAIIHKINNVNLCNPMAMKMSQTFGVCTIGNTSLVSHMTRTGR